MAGQVRRAGGRFLAFFALWLAGMALVFEVGRAAFVHGYMLPVATCTVSVLRSSPNAIATRSIPSSLSSSATVFPDHCAATGEEGVTNMKLIDAIYRSSERDEEVAVG